MLAHQSEWSRDPQTDAQSFGIHHLDDPPHNRLLGPVFARGPASGLIAIDGQTVCAWGEPDRPDMTFSVTKTYLALTAGIAFDRGILPPLDEPVYRRLPGLGFDGAQPSRHPGSICCSSPVNGRAAVSECPSASIAIGWPVFSPHRSTAAARATPGPLAVPGSYWEYNDVRINQFSLALLHLFRRPLPEVFAESIAAPLGLSDTWRWSGYDNSWVEIDGRPMQSVPGGGHWGGGMRISARDQLRIAQMMLDDGRWQGRQVISADWLRKCARRARSRRSMATSPG
ncbi:MAG: serine hydrolase domain-containing protein [Burkholderiaceae bacterium]